MARLKFNVGMDSHYVNVIQMFTKQGNKRLNVINTMIIVMMINS